MSEHNSPSAPTAAPEDTRGAQQEQAPAAPAVTAASAVSENVAGQPPIPADRQPSPPAVAATTTTTEATTHTAPAPATTTAPAPLDVEPEPLPAGFDPATAASEDGDSLYGDSIASSNTSINSEVVRYEWKHGRRYHSYQAGSYSFPNDDVEQERLDMIHHVFYRLLEDRLFLAPIQRDLEEKPLSILDIGTGTGLWAIEMGDRYPNITVTGNDLSPIQPQWVPPNVNFLVDDVEMDWHQPARYDYIHCRYMAGSIKDWPRLVSQIYDSLKPGGWVEFHESANTLYSEDGSVTPDNPMVQLMNGLHEACDKIGRTMDPAPGLAGWARAARFEGVEERRFRLPIGNWPRDARLKEVGTLMGLNFFEGVGSWTPVLFGDVLGWGKNEIEILNMSVRAAARRKDWHPMFDFLVVTGRKPGGDA